MKQIETLTEMQQSFDTFWKEAMQELPECEIKIIQDNFNQTICRLELQESQTDIDHETQLILGGIEKGNFFRDCEILKNFFLSKFSGILNFENNCAENYFIFQDINEIKQNKEFDFKEFLAPSLISKNIFMKDVSNQKVLSVVSQLDNQIENALFDFPRLFYSPISSVCLCHFFLFIIKPLNNTKQIELFISQQLSSKNISEIFTGNINDSFYLWFELFEKAKKVKFSNEFGLVSKNILKCLILLDLRKKLFDFISLEIFFIHTSDLNFKDFQVLNSFLYSFISILDNELFPSVDLLNSLKTYIRGGNFSTSINAPNSSSAQNDSPEFNNKSIFSKSFVEKYPELITNSKISHIFESWVEKIDFHSIGKLNKSTNCMKLLISILAVFRLVYS